MERGACQSVSCAVGMTWVAGTGTDPKSGADCEEASEATVSTLISECRHALIEDGAEATVLGCPGMAHLVPQLTGALKVPIIEGVAAAIETVEGLIALGIGTSKIGKRLASTDLGFRGGNFSSRFRAEMTYTTTA
jgi:Asp/Glu/hydantoin racemase